MSERFRAVQYSWRSLNHPRLKVSVKENEVPTEKNSSRAIISATKASYISRFYFIESQNKALKFFALELRGIEFTAEAPALSRC